MSETFKKEIRIRPAFDKRDPDPAKNCGIHGAELAFFLRGPAGTIQFVLFTQWHLPHVARELFGDSWRDTHQRLHCEPMPADIGYHSPVPMYGGQTPMDEECEFVEGGRCYYDGSSLRAKDFYECMVAEGDAGLWRKLEQEYRARFGTD